MTWTSAPGPARKPWVSAALFALAVWLVPAGPAAAELDDGQKKTLGDARSHLKQAQTNLNLAEESAGPADRPVPASKAKLATVRLGQAKASASQVTARLDKLPADDPGVKEAREQVDAVSAAMAKLESRLTARAPAAPVDPAGPKDPPPAVPVPVDVSAAGEKLDYKQVDSLKDARFFVTDVEGKAAAAAKVAEEATAAPDPEKIDHRLVQKALNTIADARQKAKSAKDRLDALPAGGQGVAPVAKSLQQAVASLDASEQGLSPIHDRLAKLINPASHPNLAADTKRLGELAAMYGNANLLREDPRQAADRIREAPAAQAEHDRILLAYRALIHQRTEEGKRLESASLHFKEKIQTFTAGAAEQKKSLPGEIEADLAEAGTLADQAVAEQKPAFFGSEGGIEHRMKEADDKLVLLAALDAEAAKELQARGDQLRLQLKTREASLKDAIVNANDLPPDRYAGDDRASLEKIAADAWLKIRPDDKVLAIRIPSENWKRETLWRNQTGDWYQIDRSSLQVQLVVKHDDRLAVVRPINLWKDHLQNDQIKGLPMDGKDDTLPPQRFLPSNKVK